MKVVLGDSLSRRRQLELTVPPFFFLLHLLTSTSPTLPLIGTQPSGMASLPIETASHVPPPLSSSSRKKKNGGTTQGQSTVALPKPPLDPVFFEFKDGEGMKPVRDLVYVVARALASLGDGGGERRRGDASSELTRFSSLSSLRRENYKGVTRDPLGFLRQVDDAIAGKGWRAYENVSRRLKKRTGREGRSVELELTRVSPLLCSP